MNSRNVSKLMELHIKFVKLSSFPAIVKQKVMYTLWNNFFEKSKNISVVSNERLTVFLLQYRKSPHMASMHSPASIFRTRIALWIPNTKEKILNKIRKDIYFNNWYFEVSYKVVVRDYTAGNSKWKFCRWQIILYHKCLRKFGQATCWSNSSSSRKKWKTMFNIDIMFTIGFFFISSTYFCMISLQVCHRYIPVAVSQATFMRCSSFYLLYCNSGPPLSYKYFLLDILTQINLVSSTGILYDSRYF